ncbi:MAG TPA: hypothetical protein VKA84_05030, partial [Gemmatimonadaceae bacterium]|nr:hypothetical protein [Gemmatimonadaceae bacterium]
LAAGARAGAAQAPAPALQNGAAVELRFASPTSVVVVRRNGDTLRLREMRFLAGRVRAERGDTLRLEVGESRDEAGRRQSFRGGDEAEVVLDGATTLRVINRRPAGSGVLVVLLFLVPIYLLGRGMSSMT